MSSTSENFTRANSSYSQSRMSSQHGIMLLGLIVAVGIIGSVGGLFTTAIFQFSRANSVTGAFDEVSVQTNRASRWLTRDIRNHATTDIPLSGTAQSATFNIPNSGGGVSSCNYSLSGTDLVRDCDGTVNIAGSNIENLEFSRAGTSIDVSFDVISSSRPDISDPVDLVIRSDVSPMVTGRMGLLSELEETSTVPIDVIDFETDGEGSPLAPGETVDDDFASLGINVWVTGHHHGTMVFNSSSPTGGDKDLGTPHEDFGGPGKGNGGQPGQPGENSVDLGNVLIISEDGDSNDPDDEAHGGVIHFGFTTPVDVCSVGMLDIEESFATIDTYNSEGILINSHPILDYGDNGVQTVSIGDTNVAEMQITLPGSGAVTFIAFSCS